MIVLIGSQKGGVGKSTLSANISAHFAQNKLDFILVDTDAGFAGQESVTSWVEYRDETDLPEVDVVEATGDIRNNLKGLNKKYDYVVVDAAGRDSKELRTGMLACDLAILPFGVGQYELNTLPRMVDIVTQAREFSPSLKAFAILNRVRTNTKLQRKIEEAREVFKKFPEIPLLNTVLYEREPFNEGNQEGRGVVEMNKPSAQKAKSEFLSMINELAINCPNFKLDRGVAGNA